MSFKQKNQLLENTDAKFIKTFEQAMKDADFVACGENVGTYSLNDGDVIEWESLDNVSIRRKVKTIRKEKRNLLSVSAKVNGSWDWVPLWAIRKKTPSKADMPQEVVGHQMHAALLRAENDLERYRLIAGKKFKVSVVEVELVNPETGKEYTTVIYLLNEVENKRR